MYRGTIHDLGPKTYLLSPSQCYTWDMTDKERASRRAALVRFYALNPWYKSWLNARAKCESVNHPYYARIGARGVKCLLTKEDMAAMWARDNAAGMNRPHLDRIDRAGHYSLTNCRFIDSAESARKKSRLMVLANLRRLGITPPPHLLSDK